MKIRSFSFTKFFLIFALSIDVASANFMSNFSFAFGGDSDNIDKNFLRDNKKEVVLDSKNKKIYYDSTPSQKMDFDSAVAYCQDMNYLGYSDWRLPSKDELKSLLELSRSHISIKHAFQNIQKGIYWSSTQDRHKDAYYVDFDLGRYSTATYEHKFYVICVKETSE